MFFTKSLRVKAIIAALVPTVLVLVVVAVIGLYVYERLTRDIVEQRDTELAMITAARLSEGLTPHRQILQNLAADNDVQSMELVRLRRALEKAQLQLFVFDSVLVYDHRGVAVSSDPFAFERRRTDFPVPSEFEKVRSTLQPHFSDVFKDSHSGQDAILLAVPVVASGAEFKGVVAGISTLSSLLSDATYSAVLEITAGGEGFAYLVDGNGRVIYHRDSSQLGRDLSDTTPVMQVRLREADAVITEDSAGQKVISGFAPVPGTSWGVITQEEWSNVVGPIQNYGKLLVALLVLGGLISGVLIFLAIGRILRPIKELARGAQRIAGGDFVYTINATTGDEIQELAQQFNLMAGALKESYTDLEQKVASRTEELQRSEERLRTVVTGAPIVLFAMDRDGVFTFFEGRGLEYMGNMPDQPVGRSVFEMYRHVPQSLEDARRALKGEEFTSIVEVDGAVFETRFSPMRAPDGEREGVIGVATDITERRRAEEELRESEERFRRLMENAAEAFLVADPDGRLVNVNQMACEQFGYDRDELLKLSISDIYTPLNAGEVSEVYDGLVSSGVPVTLEGTGWRRDGTGFPIEAR